MSDSPSLTLAHPGLDPLIRSLDARPALLIESHVGDGSHLSLPSMNMVSLHCCLSGNGQLSACGEVSTPLSPGTLVIMPAARAIRAGPGDAMWPDTTCRQAVVADHSPESSPATVMQVVTTQHTPSMGLMTAYLQVSCGVLGDPFGRLDRAIVIPAEHGRSCLPDMARLLEEAKHPGIGSEIMTSILLKQALIGVFRALVLTRHVWIDRLTLARDRNIARAYAAMATRPGDPHSVQSLSRIASLSRSAFMARFLSVVGCSPMSTLRRLRMQLATDLLSSHSVSLEQVSRIVGYRSSSSFCRAFHAVVGCEPRTYRLTPH